MTSTDLLHSALFGFAAFFTGVVVGTILALKRGYVVDDLVWATAWTFPALYLELVVYTYMIEVGSSRSNLLTLVLAFAVTCQYAPGFFLLVSPAVLGGCALGLWLTSAKH